MTEFLRRNSALPPYLMFPRFLLDSPLNETAKLLYIILLDRARLSQQNQGWTDDQGRVFLRFTIKSLAATIHKSEMTVKTALAALEQEGLIVREHSGVGQANRIYVKCQTDSFLSHRQTENCPFGGQKTVFMADRKLSTNKNYKIKTNYQKARSYDCREDESL
jgi:MarR-like DNA-binding transcriptional regulator SgrR of sgrS sRNA